MKQPFELIQLDAANDPELVALNLGDSEIELAGDKLPAELRLFPAGVLKTTKGDFLFDALSQEMVKDDLERSGKKRLPIDYDHQMGEAAGRFAPVIKNGELWADDIAWTKKATEELGDKRWGNYSPTFRVQWLDDGTIRVRSIICFALTNFPATIGQKSIVPLNDKKTGVVSMDPEQLAKLQADKKAAEELAASQGRELVELKRKDRESRVQKLLGDKKITAEQVAELNGASEEQLSFFEKHAKPIVPAINLGVTPTALPNRSTEGVITTREDAPLECQQLSQQFGYPAVRLAQDVQKRKLSHPGNSFWREEPPGQFQFLGLKFEDETPAANAAGGKA